ncbi:DUF262 domain-containing protein [Acinetobacter baumannii]|uniref:DUF262 domain-containing protein n=1 Tax=Acinetobacter baumannii TaxID=470 RepID=UPI0007A45648|nr:DUF262 domain-containing protein [Acinetobacter baumannii]EHU2142884.1 DUF262 domain-containing protein [Acinetobacter baumannii]EHU2653936.1 DUF262 domain-containing protein [Acinetobacter baumannii]EHU2722086.1 DUF262 domain-containing protein [Acinetobacter baumannii]EHU2840467.1 DUF262 domain-containing protein [Acinetobacter baumannii]EHU3379762.1 DUF262 domain-containing protein [Acinetobacter baumannii]
MLSANKEKIQSFLMGSSQYHIPFFQRPYVWKIENWQEFIESVIEQTEMAGDSESEHFIGTIIVQQKESTKIGAIEYDLVDGQQRLTTICLLLKAIQDLAQKEATKNWIQTLLTFTDSEAELCPRIIHSRKDVELFESILFDASHNEKSWKDFEKLSKDQWDDYFNKALEHKTVLGCYLYFRNAVNKYLNSKNIDIDTQDQLIKKIVQTILIKLPVIHMALSKKDDVQEIFDTINSQGVKLTTAELLKNFLFKNNEKSIKLYQENWYSIFEANEDDIEFWSSDRTSGRMRRSTMELFLYSYLVITKESTVKLEKLFREYKNLIKQKNQDELVALIKDLKQHAEVYRQIPDGIDLRALSYGEYKKRFFQIASEFDITTIMPLMLFIMKQVKDEAELKKILKVLESYIARRTICKMTTKNYNNLFLSLLVEVKKWDTITSERFLNKLLTYKEDTNIFPSDEQVRKAIFNKALINKYTREVLYIISLYDLSDPKVDNHVLSLDGFSLEHLMPKKWQNNWDIPETKELIDQNNYKLLTLGNLALIKGTLNSKLRDAAWSSKRKDLDTYSTLKRTRECLDKEIWDVKQIDERSHSLFKAIMQIWPKESLV